LEVGWVDLKLTPGLESLTGAGALLFGLRRDVRRQLGGYIPGARGFDALLVGVYENKGFIFVAKVKDGFVPRISNKHFPALKALQTAQGHFRNLPEI
jgi:hypothetical protein